MLSPGDEAPVSRAHIAYVAWQEGCSTHGLSVSLIEVRHLEVQEHLAKSFRRNFFWKVFLLVLTLMAGFNRWPAVMRVASSHS